MKSLKSLLTLTSLALAVSGSALATESEILSKTNVLVKPSSSIENIKADVKSETNDKLKSMTDSASSTKSSALDKVNTAKEKATSAKDAVKDKATSAKDAVKEKASALKEKATENNQPSMKDKATEKLNSVKDNAKEKASDAKTKAADKVKEVKDKATSTKESAKDKVASSAKVNINKADAETLQKLSGIGEKKAQAIIDYRNKVGKIKSAAELSNIDGIGEATIEKITPFLSF